MSFWSSEMLKERNADEELITPFDESQVKHGAYQMRLGSEYYLTSDEPQHKRMLGDGGQIAIPPGQFALLLTLERVKVPLDSIAFISIRARYKLRGLVNVSGFHVDPGFNGHLKFGVYNAGSSQVVIDSGLPMFSIWFCKFVQPTKDTYDGHWKNQSQISGEDVMMLQGKVSSPAELRVELDKLQKKVNGLRRWVAGIGSVCVTIAVGLIVAVCTMLLSPPSGTHVEVHPTIMQPTPPAATGQAPQSADNKVDSKSPQP